MHFLEWVAPLRDVARIVSVTGLWWRRGRRSRKAHENRYKENPKNQPQQQQLLKGSPKDVTPKTTTSNAWPGFVVRWVCKKKIHVKITRRSLSERAALGTLSRSLALGLPLFGSLANCKLHISACCLPRTPARSMNQEPRQQQQITFTLGRAKRRKEEWESGRARRARWRARESWPKASWHCSSSNNKCVKTWLQLLLLLLLIIKS